MHVKTQHSFFIPQICYMFYLFMNFIIYLGNFSFYFALHTIIDML